MKKKIFIGITTVIAILLIIVTVVVVRDLGEERKLKDEVNKIANLDLLEEDVDMTIITKNEYGIVEKTIKEYINEYGKIAKETVSLMQDKRTTNLLSIDNYEQDGKEFIESKTYIKDTQEKINTNISRLIELTRKENMQDAIKDNNLDDYYIDLYNDLMFGNIKEEELNNTIEELEQAAEIMNKLFDTSMKVLNFLTENQDYWVIRNDRVEFSSAELVNEYNNLISTLNS